MIQLVMPKLGLTMTEGTLTRWMVSQGDFVKKGDPLFEVETDKLTNIVEAPADGTILKIVAQAGSKLPVKELTGYLGDAGESVPEHEVTPSSELTTQPNVSDTEDNHFDVVVLGGGIGGYSAAIRAAQLGSKVALISGEQLGGTCLNVGCIPTKILLNSAETFQSIKQASVQGIEGMGTPTINWEKLQLYKQSKVDNLVRGVGMLLESNQITRFDQYAKFVDKQSLQLDDGMIVHGKNIIIASGSMPSRPPIQGLDLEGILDSTDALELPELPQSIIIVGGGIIGIEFASFLNDFGTKVTIIEMLPTIGGNMDAFLAETLQYQLEEKGVEIMCNSLVSAFEKTTEGFKVSFKNDSGENTRTADKILVATGRMPNTKGFGLEEIGIKMEKQAIVVNNYLETNVQNIYAVGDVTGKSLLAHVAEKQGIIAAENIHGKQKAMDYRFIPSCIYTSPEAAWIGMTEEQARKKYREILVGVFPLYNNSKSVVVDQTVNTFFKVVADKKFKTVLGVTLYGPQATELVSVLSLGLSLEVTLDELQDLIFAHPTVSEALKEVSLAADNRAIHQLKQ